MPALSPFPSPLLGRLLQADCIPTMRRLPDNCVDFLHADPPYLVRFCDRTGRRLRNDDNGAWLRPAFAEAFRILRPGRYAVMWYGWPKAERFLAAWREAGFRLVGHFVAPKAYTSSRRLVEYRHEQAYLLAKGDPIPPFRVIPDVLPWRYTGNKLHPTQKPLCALLPLVEAFSAPYEIAFDPFAGSASALVAAYLTRRRFCGVELDPHYHALASHWLADIQRRRGVRAA